MLVQVGALVGGGRQPTSFGGCAPVGSRKHVARGGGNERLLLLLRRQFLRRGFIAAGEVGDGLQQTVLRLSSRGGSHCSLQVGTGYCATRFIRLASLPRTSSLGWHSSSKKIPVTESVGAHSKLELLLSSDGDGAGGQVNAGRHLPTLVIVCDYVKHKELGEMPFGVQATPFPFNHSGM